MGKIQNFGDAYRISKLISNFLPSKTKFYRVAFSRILPDFISAACLVIFPSKLSNSEAERSVKLSNCRSILILNNVFMRFFLFFFNIV